MKIIHHDDELLQKLGGRGAYAFDGVHTYRKLSQPEIISASDNTGGVDMPYEEVGVGTITKLDEDNPTVEGTLIEIREGLYGPLFDIKTEDGVIVTLPSDTVLQTKIAKSFIGKVVKIEFMGLIPSTRRKGKEYKDYKVFVMK